MCKGVKDNVYHWGQRARAGGYLNKDRALLIHKEIRLHYPQLISTISCETVVIPHHLKYATITFKNGNPMYAEARHNESLEKNDKLDEEEILKQQYGIHVTPYSDGNASKNSHRWLLEDYPTLNRNAFNNTVYIDVMSKEWNDNSVLWTALLQIGRAHV